MGAEIGRMGIGRFKILISDDDTTWPEDLEGANHHVGTTRMHDDSSQGVVDRNCKVHGIDNLYIAGSSVFPTAGIGTPTLMIVALALRLADRVREVTT
jgi:choline dehydrogenase-like flavoprotein